MTDPRSDTIAAYQADAVAYAEGTRAVPGSVTRDLDDFAARVVAGGRVLEIGSGPGRDARELWREEPLRAVLDEAGWEVRLVRRSESPNATWLDVVAERRDERGRRAR